MKRGFALDPEKAKQAQKKSIESYMAKPKEERPKMGFAADPERARLAGKKTKRGKAK